MFNGLQCMPHFSFVSNYSLITIYKASSVAVLNNVMDLKGAWNIEISGRFNLY